MLVSIILPLILAFIMFSLGLGLKARDFTQILKFPKAFAMGLTNQLLLLPVITFALISIFGYSGELAVGIMILAFSPGGVTTNVLTRIVHGNVPLSISMTGVTSLLSIVTVPLMVSMVVLHFMGSDAPDINITKLGLQMFFITALPVLLGMLTTKLMPALVEKISGIFSKLSMSLFVIIVLAAIAKNWDVVWSNLPTLGPMLALLNILLLSIGYISAKFVGLDRSDGFTIAIETGIQNGTLAIAVGTLITVNLTAGVDLPPITVPAAVYAVTMYVISMPTLWWLRRQLASKQPVAKLV